MQHVSVKQTFADALAALVERIKEDRSILAAILCGSLSHDTVWKKSDIDLVLVTIDDKNVEASDLALNADGVNVHALLIPRAQFRSTVEGSIRSSSESRSSTLPTPGTAASASSLEAPCSESSPTRSSISRPSVTTAKAT